MKHKLLLTILILIILTGHTSGLDIKSDKGLQVYSEGNKNLDVKSNSNVEIPEGNLSLEKGRIWMSGGSASYIERESSDANDLGTNNPNIRLHRESNSRSAALAIGNQDNESYIVSDDLHGILMTPGSGSGGWKVRDSNNNIDIARFNEGGNVEIPNGDLDLSNNTIVSTGLEEDSSILRFSTESGQGMSLTADSNKNMYRLHSSSGWCIGEDQAPDVPCDIAIPENSNVGIGLDNPQHKLTVEGKINNTGDDIIDVGTLNAESKNFVQDINGTHEAVYTSQESADARAVVEGSVVVDGGLERVDLPRHFDQVVSDSEPSLNVQVTPRELATVAVTERSADEITIESTEDVKVDYRVTGVREGFEDKKVVRKK